MYNFRPPRIAKFKCCHLTLVYVLINRRRGCEFHGLAVVALVGKVLQGLQPILGYPAPLLQLPEPVH